MEKIENKENLIVRPPIVAVMGHIDHGKTKLLDAIRKSNVVEGESGGITQHIGAYEIIMDSESDEYRGRKITFLDTPGHEAFSKIRERGAQVADIAVLVVAADDGVKPQTIEAIKSIEDAKIPYIVAINKIDKPEANPNQVRTQLAENNIFLEDWGGKIPVVEISAKENTNIQHLLEMILLVADLEELKSNPSLETKGIVIESKMDKNRGPIATIIIKEGVLKIGDNILTSTAEGKLKILENFKGEKIKEATFSSPVSVGGFKKMPQVGELFLAGEKIDRELLKKELADKKDISSDMLDLDKDGKIINLIIKADVSGSLEAIENIIKKLKLERVSLRIINSSIGDISNSDIQMAKDSPAWIFGFKINIPKSLNPQIQEKNIHIHIFDIIYDLEKFLKEKLEIISQKEEEMIKAELRVLKTFSKQGKKQLIGGVVEEGKIKKGLVIIQREEKEIGRGRIMGLQCHKKDIAEAEKGMECGILLETAVDISPDDHLINS